MIDRETIKQLAAECGMGFNDPVPTKYEEHVDRWMALAAKVAEMERSRIFTIVGGADPSAIWRDEGFRQWHLSRLPQEPQT